MKKTCIKLIGLLFIWFSLDMTGFSFGGITLVEAAWNSIDGVWWLIFTALSLLFVFRDKIGTYLLSIFMFMWAFIQFSSHWYYTFFGATEKKLVSYNRYFENTYHIIPASSTVIIPDLYHIVLHVLILANLICLTAFIVKNRKLVSKNIPKL